jgi:hypothetical protein
MDAMSDILARIEHDRGCWRTIARLRCWPEPIEIGMFADDSGPTPYQKKVLQAILDHQTDLKSLIERPAFEFCKQFAGETFGSLDDDCNFIDFEFPALTEPAEIWDLIDAPSIDIPDFGDPQHIEFEVSFHCRFDIEHGMNARFVDFRVDGVSN